MKANAPEKIYISPKVFNIGEYVTKVLTTKYIDNVEYTRTDAFIEKACAWIKENITNNPECNRIISKKGVITKGEIVKDFRKYMEGE